MSEITCEFAANLDSESAAMALKEALYQKNLSFSQFELDVENKRLLITSQHPPSQLLKVLQSTQVPIAFRTATGTHMKNTNPYSEFPTAGVCLLEHFSGQANGKWAQHDNRGIVRIIQLDEDTSVFDVAVHDLKECQEYELNVHECGDLTQPPTSLGQVEHFVSFFKTDQVGQCQFVVENPVKVWNLIGKSLAVKFKESNQGFCSGIIARSAGLFENEKKVCSCSGKTIWEESRL